MTIPPPPPQNPPTPPGGTPPPIPPNPPQGPPPMPGGPTGYPQQSPVQAKKTNGLAVASMVMGILGCCWILSIPAIITGFIARGKAKELGGVGAGQALAGIVLGIAWGILGIIGTILFIFVGTFDFTVSSEGSSFSNRESSVARSDFEISDTRIIVTDTDANFLGTIKNMEDETQSYIIYYDCEDEISNFEDMQKIIFDVEAGETESFDFNIPFAGTDEVECVITDVTYYSFDD